MSSGWLPSQQCLFIVLYAALSELLVRQLSAIL